MTTSRRDGPGFLSLALGATVVIGGMVVGLLAIRARHAERNASVGTESPASSGPVVSPSPTAPARAPHQDAAVVALRSALPANAWVVLDVDLSLLGAAGWADPKTLRPLDCEDVPPPARLAFALMPSRYGAAPDQAGTPGWPGARGEPKAPAAQSNDAPDLVVAALGASEAFRACAKRKLFAEGATESPWPGGFEVIASKTNTRLVIDAAHDRMLFATATAPTTSDLIGVLQGARPSANDDPTHRTLSGTLGMRALGVTVTLPTGWLERAGGGPEAAQSPLAALRSGALGLRLDGSLEAELTCAGAVGAQSAPAPGDKMTPSDAQLREPNGAQGSGQLREQSAAQGSGQLREQSAARGHDAAPTCGSLARFIARAKDDLLAQLPPERRKALGEPFQLVERSPTQLHVTWRVQPSEVAALLGGFVGR